jgi:signal transduction histidine kinase
VVAALLTLAMIVLQGLHLYRDSELPGVQAVEVYTIIAEVAIFVVAIGGWILFLSRMRVSSARLLQEETMRKQTQRELIEAQKIEALGQLAAGVAHDFGNQLAVINGSLDAVSAHLPPGSATAGDLERARSAARQASQTVNSLMLFGRRSSGRKVPVDLTDVANEASALTGAMLPSDIDVELRVPGTPLWTDGDRTQLVQVLLNLILNARDAMPDGGTITIEASCVGEARASTCPQVQLAVSDTGTGMSSDVAERVFEPFFTTRVGHGTGLGLSVVHGIVASMDGVITVTSVPDEGTRFDIIVPTATGRTCRAVLPPIGPVSPSDIVAVDLDDEYRSSLVVEALVHAGISARRMPIDAARHTEKIRVIIVQGAAIARISSKDGTNGATLIAVDAPKDVALPVGTRVLTSPVPVGSLIEEVMSTMSAEVTP